MCKPRLRVHHRRLAASQQLSCSLNLPIGHLALSTPRSGNASARLDSSKAAPAVGMAIIAGVPPPISASRASVRGGLVAQPKRSGTACPWAFGEHAPVADFLAELGKLLLTSPVLRSILRSFGENETNPSYRSRLFISPSRPHPRTILHL